MQVFFDIPNIEEDTTIAIGTFDGLHLGHQSVLKNAKKIALENNQKLLIFTFTDHPAIITGSKKVPQILTMSDEKVNLLKSYESDSDYCVMPNFSKDFSILSPEEFIENILVKKLKAKNICVGFNFFFGYKAQGNEQTLKNFSKKYNYDVEVVKPVKYEGQNVSSSVIRELLTDGEISKANQLLNYKYYLRGQVVRGRGLGKTVLGIPTANILVSERKLIPKNGVYCCDVKVKDKNYVGVTNIGNRPTFDNGLKSIEVHILDFDDDIYGNQIEINFSDYLRPEKKFDGIEKLKEQILIDIELCRNESNSLA
ncbi:MAG: bifunctional riboflavin kinase/FAD synthetase [Candidatus Sericytochromatia bacterium]|nr:bifunctional riboflavin kinase/FAD synthetase [Candidatus Sericytochromatia bacterium]